jgi:hypothetical protein
VLDFTTGTAPVAGSWSNQGTYVKGTGLQVSGAQSAVAGGKVEITVTMQSYPGHYYQLQRTDLLGPVNWVDVGSPQAGTGGVLSFTDPAGITGNQGYYRVVVSP